MKYYYKHSDNFEICLYGKTTTIGSHMCTNICEKFININHIEHYVECKYHNLLDRNKKLKSL